MHEWMCSERHSKVEVRIFDPFFPSSCCNPIEIDSRFYHYYNFYYLLSRSPAAAVCTVCYKPKPHPGGAKRRPNAPFTNVLHHHSRHIISSRLGLARGFHVEFQYHRNLLRCSRYIVWVLYCFFSSFILVSRSHMPIVLYRPHFPIL